LLIDAAHLEQANWDSARKKVWENHARQMGARGWEKEWSVWKRGKRPVAEKKVRNEMGLRPGAIIMATGGGRSKKGGQGKQTTT